MMTVSARRRVSWPRVPGWWLQKSCLWPTNTRFPCCPHRRWPVRFTGMWNSNRKSPCRCTRPWPKFWPGSISCAAGRPVRARSPTSLAIYPYPPGWTRRPAWPGALDTMNALLALLRDSGSVQARLLVGPVLILMVMAMMVLPLPPVILDLLFTFNISLSVMILLVAMFTRHPLDFAAFPAVLLFATLLRLALNVASTRVVLMNGHKGPDAAGRVIEAFGHFLVGGNFAVGIVVFVILVIINFVVITKGAGRIAEVGARFTLDALPGKQMAID